MNLQELYKSFVSSAFVIGQLSFVREGTPFSSSRSPGHGVTLFTKYRGRDVELLRVDIGRFHWRLLSFGWGIEPSISILDLVGAAWDSHCLYVDIGPAFLRYTWNSIGREWERCPE